MAWDAATIEAFIDDVDGQATAWYTAISGTPVVLPGTDPGFTQQQLAALAGARAVQTGSPLATYAIATPASFAQQPWLLVGGLILLAVLLLRG